jgi:hypothetical protein
MANRQWLAILVILSVSAGVCAAPSTSTVEVPARPSRWELVPEISILNPGSFTISNETYAAHYSNPNTMFGLPSVIVGGAYRLATANNLVYYLDVKVGYGGKSGAVAVNRKLGGREVGEAMFQDVRLHWLPVSIGARALWSIPGVTFVRPTLSVGGGSSLVIQTSELPGFNSTYLLPFYHITPGLTFLEGTRNPGDWFGGFHFGFSYISTFATDQALRGTSVDLSVNILL